MITRLTDKECYAQKEDMRSFDEQILVWAFASTTLRTIAFSEYKSYHSASVRQAGGKGGRRNDKMTINYILN